MATFHHRAVINEWLHNIRSFVFCHEWVNCICLYFFRSSSIYCSAVGFFQYIFLFSMNIFHPNSNKWNWLEIPNLLSPTLCHIQLSSKRQFGSFCYDSVINTFDSHLKTVEIPIKLQNQVKQKWLHTQVSSQLELVSGNRWKMPSYGIFWMLHRRKHHSKAMTSWSNVYEVNQSGLLNCYPKYRMHWMM